MPSVVPPTPPSVPPPDPAAEPEGFVVVLDPDRLHFLDWGEPTGGEPVGTATGRAKTDRATTDGVATGSAATDRAAPATASATGVLLVHGLAGTAWSWSPVARRIHSLVRTVAVDLRGHGLSDAPTEGYDPDGLADDLEAVIDGSGLGERVVLAGHGFGAIVAAWTAARIGERCAGLVLVDGGWTDLKEATGLEPAEWLRGLEEPPEVMRSIGAYLADRMGFDPASWDADQDRAARAAVVEVPAGHVVPVTRPHVLAGSVEAMFAYRPAVVLPSVAAPIAALVQDQDELARPALEAAQEALEAAGRPPIRVAECGPVGHNLPRYRPALVAGAILELAAATMTP